MKPVKNYGLSCPPPIRWLMESEKDVFDAVKKFIAGMAKSNVIDVAGPPSFSDILEFYDKRGQTVPLPCVRLNLKMVKHHLTGEPGVEVTCSDADLIEIAKWHRLARMKPAAVA